MNISVWLVAMVFARKIIFLSFLDLFMHKHGLGVLFNLVHKSDATV